MGFLGRSKGENRPGSGADDDGAISIVGPGMTVHGDCETGGTIRVDGRVFGSIRAGKAVVVGRDGVVEGDVFTSDAVVSGRIVGTVTAESRLELQATATIEGEVHTYRLQLDEGAVLDGAVTVHRDDPDSTDGEGVTGAEEGRIAGDRHRADEDRNAPRGADETDGERVRAAR